MKHTTLSAFNKHKTKKNKLPPLNYESQAKKQSFKIFSNKMKISPETEIISSDRLHFKGDLPLSSHRSEATPLVGTNLSAKMQSSNIEVKPDLLFSKIEKIGSLEDGNKTNFVFQKLQIMDISTGFIAMIGTFLTVMSVR